MAMKTKQEQHDCVPVVETGEVGFCPACGHWVAVKVPPDDRLQARVAAAVARRGYRRGWTPVAFFARQVVKLQEELGEVVEAMAWRMPIHAAARILAAADVARLEFRIGHDWPREDPPREVLEKLREELADLQVVVYNMATALGEMLGEDVDSGREAAAKAERDVERGVV